jgi:hypothetical protein
MSVEAAADILAVSVVTLRRALERAARRRPEGGVEAAVDGVRGRKFGRVWRVALDQGWLEPSRRSA